MKESTPVSFTAEDDAILEQAAAWLTKVQEGISPADRALLQHWLQADPLHAAAMDLVHETWLKSAAAARSVAARERSFRTSTLTRANAPERRRGVPLGLRWAAAAIACVLLGVFAFRSATTEVTYRTGRGETTSVELSDGSRLRLDAATTVLIHIGPLVRRAELINGEAEFDVAHEARRPFRVEAGGFRVRDIGTRFTVRNRAGTVRVIVLEGRVELRDAQTSGSTAAELGPGQQAVESQGRLVISSADLQSALAWRDGRIVLDDVALADAVAEWRTRMPVEIAISDPSLARLRVTGTYRLTDLTAFLNALSRIYPITWQETSTHRYEIRSRARSEN